MTNLNIPIYRAKRVDSDEYVEGYYLAEYQDTYCTRKLLNVIYFRADEIIFEIDLTTLSIHFPDMIDSENNKIFASLGSKGGDIVEGKCRDINDVEIIGLHKPLPFKGIVRFYNETSMSIVIETQTELVASTEQWSQPLVKRQGDALRWSDCRQDLKVIGIQE